MSDRMFADCCYGTEQQHLPTDPCPQEGGGFRVTEADFERANELIKMWQRELDITNADRVALWLETNIDPGDDEKPIAWLACRIVEAHEAALAALRGPLNAE